FNRSAARLPSFAARSSTFPPRPGSAEPLLRLKRGAMRTARMINPARVSAARPARSAASGGSTGSDTRKRYKAEHRKIVAVATRMMAATAAAIEVSARDRKRSTFAVSLGRPPANLAAMPVEEEAQESACAEGGKRCDDGPLLDFPGHAVGLAPDFGPDLIG